MRIREIRQKARELIEEAIQSDDWEVAESEDNYHEGYPDTCEAYFLGTVFAIMPSGKYYTAWANSNVTDQEAYQDQHMMDFLEEFAGIHNCWIESGMGDPCDLFLYRTRVPPVIHQPVLDAEERASFQMRVHKTFKKYSR